MGLTPQSAEICAATKFPYYESLQTGVSNPASSFLVSSEQRCPSKSPAIATAHRPRVPPSGHNTHPTRPSRSSLALPTHKKTKSPQELNRVPPMEVTSTASDIIIGRPLSNSAMQSSIICPIKSHSSSSPATNRCREPMSESGVIT